MNSFEWKTKMLETVKEVLKSNNVDLVRRTRLTFKGKLTRVTNYLKEELKKDDTGVFQFDKIDQTEVNSILATIQEVNDIVDELHLKFTVMRVQGEGLEENKLVKEDEAYAEMLEKTHHEAIKLYNAFIVQLKAKEQLAQYQDKVRRFKAKIIEYDSAHQEALAVVSSKDEFVRRTATFQKDMICKEYDLLLNMGLELSSLMENVTLVDLSDQELFNCSKEKLIHRKTLTSLEKIIKTYEVEDSEKLVKLAPAPTVNGDLPTSSAVGLTRSSNVLKIKVSAPKFSGKSREFAVFKRDFKAIVAVDERNNVEIGALLKESIPDNYKYLLDKYDLSEHTQMMDELTQKFGRPRVIIDECTADIKKIEKTHYRSGIH